jgi:hypothetical protein
LGAVSLDADRLVVILCLIEIVATSGLNVSGIERRPLLMQQCD